MIHLTKQHRSAGMHNQPHAGNQKAGKNCSNGCRQHKATASAYRNYDEYYFKSFEELRL
jgi:hypothetical protein